MLLGGGGLGAGGDGRGTQGLWRDGLYRIVNAGGDILSSAGITIKMAEITNVDSHMEVDGMEDEDEEILPLFQVDGEEVRPQM